MKKILVVFFAFVVLLSLQSCNNNASEELSSESPSSTGTVSDQSDVKKQNPASVYTASTLEACVPDGFSAVESNGKVTISKQNSDEDVVPSVSIEVYGHDVSKRDNDAIFEMIVLQWNAEKGGAVVIDGIEFQSASYSWLDCDYIVMQGLKSGRQIAITVSAMDSKDENLKAILGSVKFLIDEE